MTSRRKSRGAAARLAIAAFALTLSGAAVAADYFGPGPSVGPDYPPPPPPPPPAYPPPPPVVVEPVAYPYLWGGQRYCWYDDAWNGPGWYFCGAAWRQGYGWGGPYGWNRWVWSGWRGWRGWGGGWRPGGPWRGGGGGWQGGGGGWRGGGGGWHGGGGWR